MTTTETVVLRAMQHHDVVFMSAETVSTLSGVRATDLSARVLPSLIDAGHIVRHGGFYRET